uniref:Uncharacterized protein n=1 Tax=Ditylenchus dipsaci TaxID=166011 RepID=A0A915DRT2_9BILA
MNMHPHRIRMQVIRVRMLTRTPEYMKGHRRSRSSSSSDGMESFVIGRKKSANQVVDTRKHTNVDEETSEDQNRSPVKKRDRIPIKNFSAEGLSKTVQLPSVDTFVKKCKMFNEMARELQDNVYAISDEVREMWKESTLD